MKNPEHLPALDGLRGMAALMVIAFHLWLQGYLGDRSIARVAIIGQTGVDLFFVLSGFLITRILLSSRDEPGHLMRFYVRRSLRIFPLYYLGLLAYTQLFPLLTSSRAAPISQEWWFWLYLQGIPLTLPGIPWSGPAHYWSLAVEEHFYLLWPWVVTWVPTRRLPIFSLSLILFTVACRWEFIHKLNLGIFFATPCRLDGLALGSLLASAERSGPHAAAKNALRRWSPTLCVVLGFVLLALWPRLSQSGSMRLGVFKFTGISMFYATAVGWLVFCPQSGGFNAVMHAFLGSGPARALGRISYGLYVYHPLCLSLAQTWMPHRYPPLTVIAAVLASTVAVSWASFRYFEQPLLKLRPRR
jgi:peptidoglycan/LPS O-acetylase OafA/YrhL